MTLPFRPSRATLIAVATAAALLLVLLVAGMAIAVAWRIAAAMIAALFLAIAGDYVLSKRRWQLAAPTMTRRLPTAFAIGVRKEVTLSLSLSESATGWRCRLYDHVDATLQTTGLPMDVTLVPGSIVDVTYFVVPRLLKR